MLFTYHGLKVFDNVFFVSDFLLVFTFSEENLEQSLQLSAAAAVNPTQARIQQLEAQLRRLRTQGSVLLGRWFQERGLRQDQSLRARMDVALRDSLKRPRDRRLFGLSVEGGRSLRSELAENELATVRAELLRLRKLEEELSREAKSAKRKEDEARLILEGEVIKRWREKDAAFAERLAADLTLYLRHAHEFAVVDLPVPENWQPVPREAQVNAGSAKDGVTTGAAGESSAEVASSSDPKPEATKTAPVPKQDGAVPPKLAPRPSTGLPSPAALLTRPPAAGASVSVQPRSASTHGPRPTEGG